MSAAAGERAPQRLEGLAPVLLVAATVCIYLQTARHGFLTYDDGAYITENSEVRAGLSVQGVRWAFGEFHAANWHPLTWLSHMLDVQLFGLWAGGHHLMSAGLHALNACLCFRVLRRASARFWPSFLVALFFAVHPQRVESVAWAAERKDVLSGTFFFLTLLLYERYARAPALGRYLAVVGVFALGLLTKPMLVTLPFLLWLWDFWPLWRIRPAPRLPSLAPTHPGMAPETSGERSGFALVLEKLPLLALALASCWVTVLAQHAGGAVRSIESLPLAARAASSLLGLIAYLARALWPAGLAFFYPHPAYVSPESFSPTSLQVLLAGALVLFLSGAALFLSRRVPALFVGWFWTLGMLVPVIGLVQVGGQWIADRYAYLPLVGFTTAVVFGLDQTLSSGPVKRALAALGFSVALALGAVAFRQVGFWSDMQTLCEHALLVTERNYVAHDHLGLLYQKQKDLERAREHYQATLAIAPRLADVHSNLGAVYMELGQREQAIERYQEALRLQPDFLDPRLNWGLLYEREGDYPQALHQYEIAAGEHPESASAQLKVGDAALGLRRFDLASAAYSRALERDGALATAHAGLGLTLLEAGQTATARAHFSEALRLEPTNAAAIHGWAFLLATAADAELRDPAHALQLLGQCERQGEARSWRHLRALAAALAAQGKFSDAARAAAEASAYAPPPEREELRGERQLYQRGEALRR